MKKLIRSLLLNRIIAKMLVNISLKAHNLSYKVAGICSQPLEPDGLHPKHRLMQYHQWFINNINKDWNVLDVGCGNGALANDVNNSCKHLWGIDIEKEHIKIAKKKFPHISFILDDATKYEFQDKVDCILLSNVLEHIEVRIDFLKKLLHITDNFLIRVPMIDREWITLYKKERGIEHRLDSTHFTEYTQIQFESELAEAGLEILSLTIKFGEIYAVCRKQKTK